MNDLINAVVIITLYFHIKNTFFYNKDTIVLIVNIHLWSDTLIRLTKYN